MGGQLALRDSSPGGAFRVLSWFSGVLRRVVRSSLGGEDLSFVDASELLQGLKRFCEGVFGGSVTAIASTECRSLFSHLRGGAPRTAGLRNRLFLQLQTIVKAGAVDTACLIEGAGNTAGPFTKCERTSKAPS